MKKVFIILVTVLLYSNGFCEEQAGNKSCALSINYPGVGIKYQTTKKTELELRYQYIDDINIGGIRFYRCLGRTGGRLKKLCGIEGGYIDYKSRETEGQGMYGGAFLGGEYFIKQSFGLQMDFGAYYINLTEKEFSLSEQGVGLSINFGLNFYLF